MYAAPTCCRFIWSSTTPSTASIKKSLPSTMIKRSSRQQRSVAEAIMHSDNARNVMSDNQQRRRHFPKKNRRSSRNGEPDNKGVYTIWDTMTMISNRVGIPLRCCYQFSFIANCDDDDDTDVYVYYRFSSIGNGGG